MCVIKNEKNLHKKLRLQCLGITPLFNIHVPDVFETFPCSMPCCALSFFFNLSYGSLKNKRNL